MKGYEWVQRARAAAGIDSDRKIALKLGISTSAMTQLKKGDTLALSDDNCVIIAELCGIDPGIVIADQQAEKGSPAVRRVYERLGKLAASGAVVGLATICLSVIAQTQGNQQLATARLLIDCILCKIERLRNRWSMLRDAVPGAVMYG